MQKSKVWYSGNTKDEAKQKGSNKVAELYIYFFNSEGKTRKLGTGFMVSKKLKGAILHFKHVSDRTGYMRLTFQVNFNG